MYNNTQTQSEWVIDFDGNQTPFWYNTLTRATAIFTQQDVDKYRNEIALAWEQKFNPQQVQQTQVVQHAPVTQANYNPYSQINTNAGINAGVNLNNPGGSEVYDKYSTATPTVEAQPQQEQVTEHVVHTPQVVQVDISRYKPAIGHDKKPLVAKNMKAVRVDNHSNQTYSWKVEREGDIMALEDVKLGAHEMSEDECVSGNLTGYPLTNNDYTELVCAAHNNKMDAITCDMALNISGVLSPKFNDANLINDIYANANNLSVVAEKLSNITTSTASPLCVRYAYDLNIGLTTVVNAIFGSIYGKANNSITNFATDWDDLRNLKATDVQKAKLYAEAMDDIERVIKRMLNVERIETPDTDNLFTTSTQYLTKLCLVTSIALDHQIEQQLKDVSTGIVTKMYNEQIYNICDKMTNTEENIAYLVTSGSAYLIIRPDTPNEFTIRKLT